MPRALMHMFARLLRTGGREGMGRKEEYKLSRDVPYMVRRYSQKTKRPEMPSALYKTSPGVDSADLLGWRTVPHELRTIAQQSLRYAIRNKKNTFITGPVSRQPMLSYGHVPLEYAKRLIKNKKHADPPCHRPHKQPRKSTLPSFLLARPFLLPNFDRFRWRVKQRLSKPAR